MTYENFLENIALLCLRQEVDLSEEGLRQLFHDIEEKIKTIDSSEKKLDLLGLLSGTDVITKILQKTSDERTFHTIATAFGENLSSLSLDIKAKLFGILFDGGDKPVEEVLLPAYNACKQ